MGGGETPPNKENGFLAGRLALQRETAPEGLLEPRAVLWDARDPAEPIWGGNWVRWEPALSRRGRGVSGGFPASISSPRTDWL